jgi:TPR repeat protein
LAVEWFDGLKSPFESPPRVATGHAASHILTIKIHQASSPPVVAASRYSKAAAAGHREAQTHLANALVNGLGVPRNPSAAAAMFGHAAGLGCPDAMNGLGLMLWTADGVPVGHAALPVAPSANPFDKFLRPIYKLMT